MTPRRLWLVAAVVSVATLAAQSAPPVPSQYQDLYDELSADVSAFQQTILQSWDGSRWPVAFSANLSSADSSAGPALLAPNAMTAVRLELDGLRALGVKAVTLNLNFPVLYAPFHQSQADYQQYLDFYTQVAQEVRARGLKLVVETQAVFAQGGFANWNVAPFYDSLTLDQYEQGRAAMAETIARNLRPDYLSVIQEPDTEAQQTGKPELGTLDGSAALLDTILQGLQAAPVPGVAVGAGFGTWQTDYQTWADTFVARPLDFLDMHVYPANRDYLTRALAIADTAAAAGKQVGITEAWLFKERESELDALPLATILGRDTFSFWAPLDAQYLQALVQFAEFKHLSFVSPFWSEYFRAYVDYDASTQNLPPDALNQLARAQQAAAALAGTYTSTGQAYLDAIVDPPDVTPPSPPASVTATLTSPTSDVVYWAPAADDVGVAAYQVSRDGTPLGQTAMTSFVDSGLSDGRTYHYSVTAVDASGHVSTPAAVDLTTPDRTPPSVPANLQASMSLSGTRLDVNLTWSPSTDNVGVAQYRVYWGTSPSQLQVIAFTPTPAYTISNVPPNTTWYFAVSAVDALWNDSGRTAPVGVTTPPVPDTTPPVVSVTYPSAGAILPRTAILVAVAYDLRGGLYDTPSGVAGLQFQIDGANVGPEQTTPAYGTDQYSVYWLAVNTAGFARGAHTITAVARDGAGNLGVSPPVGVKISNR